MWLVCRQGCYPACSSFLPPASLCAAGGPSLVPASRAAWRAAGAQRGLVLPDGGQDGAGSATDVMPAFAGVTLERPMAACPPPPHPPCAPPSVQLAPCLIHHGGGRHTAPYMPFTYCYCVFVGKNKHLNQTFTGGTTYTEVCVIVSVVFKNQRTEKLSADDLWTSCLCEGWFSTVQSASNNQTRRCCKRGGETFRNVGKGFPNGSIMKHRGKERNRRRNVRTFKRLNTGTWE